MTLSFLKRPPVVVRDEQDGLSERCPGAKTYAGRLDVDKDILLNERNFRQRHGDLSSQVGDVEVVLIHFHVLQLEPQRDQKGSSQ